MDRTIHKIFPGNETIIPGRFPIFPGSDAIILGQFPLKIERNRENQAKNLSFCSIFSIFNGNWVRMIASQRGNIVNLPGMIVSFPGNILWTVRSMFELYYNSHMDHTIHYYNF